MRLQGAMYGSYSDLGQMGARESRSGGGFARRFAAGCGRFFNSGLTLESERILQENRYKAMNYFTAGSDSNRL